MKRQQLHPQCYISGVATLYPSGQQNGFLCSGRFSKMWVLELVFLLLVRDIYKRAFDEFKIRWIPPVPLVYPQPAGFFSLGCSLTKKKTADPLASMLADWFSSRLYLFKSAWSQKNKRVRPVEFLHPSGKTQRIHRTHPKFGPTCFGTSSIKTVVLIGKKNIT